VGTTKKIVGTTKKSQAKPISVPAAGAVLWRPDESGEPLIAVIHRRRYDDWSLPKGKVDPGETEPVTAVREIVEETGQQARLGRHLCRVSYPIPVGTKVVHYWAARACGGEFTPNKEVDKLLWLPAKEAGKRLTYPYDKKVIGRFLKKPADTRTVLIVRHATAGRKARYHGDDRLRPLDRKGRAQAKSLVPQLLAFGASTLYAADRSRCVQTIEPLAQKLDVPIAVEPTLTEEAYAADPEAAQKRILEIAAEADGVPTVCSQGRVIPYLIQWWCDRDGVKPDKSRNRKGSTWVLTLADGQLVAADHLPSPFARASSA